MDELDILKKHWKENQKFPKLTQEEIRSMIHKKSSSIVMWIFIISIIEFIILNVIGYIIPNDKGVKTNIPLVESFLDKFEYLSILTSIIFVFLFYKNYRKIKVYSSSKELMTQIIKTKKTVNYYIYINIAFILISLCFVFFSICYYEPTLLSENSKNIFVLIGVFIIITLFFIAIVWLFYKLIYGILLKKLTKNLKELEKINEDPI
ncbi:hypothetical protein [Myroides guanonis]|uniref:Uncharacterized protein n=1 Tax=Myroides guanonis TaxID=1150112 RepID=A0A1I3LGF7_9FLAO|nr:hypothetical protein [Myroides guanonis]SFI83620.1 hypothetical protein SAMN04487893_101312 [Myroides guanonis]